MAVQLPPPPPQGTRFDSDAFQKWLNLLFAKLTLAGQVLWSQINFAGSNLANIQTRLFTDLQFTGSNLTSLATRNHNDLQNIQGGAAADYQHLTTTQVNRMKSNQVLTWLSM